MSEVDGLCMKPLEGAVKTSRERTFPYDFKRLWSSVTSSLVRNCNPSARCPLSFRLFRFGTGGTGNGEGGHINRFRAELTSSIIAPETSLDVIDLHL